jgi:hypothetical protein
MDKKVENRGKKMKVQEENKSVEIPKGGIMWEDMRGGKEE